MFTGLAEPATCDEANTLKPRRANLIERTSRHTAGGNSTAARPARLKDGCSGAIIVGQGMAVSIDRGEGHAGLIPELIGIAVNAAGSHDASGIVGYVCPGGA